MRNWKSMFRLLAGIAAAVPSAFAFAGPKEDDTYSAFQDLCIFTIAMPSDIEHYMKELQAISLSASMTKAMLDPQPGQAWAFSTGVVDVVVGKMSAGGCLVFADGVDPQEVRRLITKNLELEPAGTDKKGSSVTEAWVATFHSHDPKVKDLRVFVSEEYSTLATLRSVRLIVLPEYLFPPGVLIRH